MLHSQAQRACQTLMQSPCKRLEEEGDINTGAVVFEGISNTSSSSHRYVFAATKRWKRLVVVMPFNVMQNQVLALQDKVDSDSIMRDPEKVLTGTGMNHRIEHFGAKQVRYQLEQQRMAMTKWDFVVSWSPIVSVQILQRRGNKVVFERVRVHRKQRMGTRQSWSCEATSAGGKQSFWSGRQTASCCAKWTVSICELQRIKQGGLT